MFTNFKETQLTENPDHYIKSNNQLTLDIEEKSLGSMAVGYYSILESAFRAKKMNNMVGDHNLHYSWTNSMKQK